MQDPVSYLLHRSLHICITKTTLFCTCAFESFYYELIFANLILINSEPSFLLKYRLSPYKFSFSSMCLIYLQKSISYCLLCPSIFRPLRNNFLANIFVFVFRILNFKFLNFEQLGFPEYHHMPFILDVFLFVVVFSAL